MQPNGTRLFTLPFTVRTRAAHCTLNIAGGRRGAAHESVSNVHVVYCERTLEIALDAIAGPRLRANTLTCIQYTPGSGRLASPRHATQSSQSATEMLSLRLGVENSRYEYLHRPSNCSQLQFHLDFLDISEKERKNILEKKILLESRRGN